MYQVVFICKSCEYRNNHYLGLDGFIPNQTEFESLTDAWEHIKQTSKDRDDVVHQVKAVIKNEGE